jgi:hypothetical protein
LFLTPPPAAATTVSRDRLNQNEGAESTLAFHIALAELRKFEKNILLEEPH